MWTLMDDVEDLVVPPDLAAAFERHPGSREHWESWSASARKMILGVDRAGQAARDPRRPGRDDRREGSARREVAALALLRQTAQPSGPHSSPPRPSRRCTISRTGCESAHACSSTCVKTSVGCAPETPYFWSITKNGTPVAP